LLASTFVCGGESACGVTERLRLEGGAAGAATRTCRGFKQTPAFG